MNILVGLYSMIAAATLAEARPDADTILQERASLEDRFDKLRQAPESRDDRSDHELVQWGNWPNWSNFWNNWGNWRNW